MVGVQASYSKDQREAEHRAWSCDHSLNKDVTIPGLQAGRVAMFECLLIVASAGETDVTTVPVRMRRSPVSRLSSVPL